MSVLPPVATASPLAAPLSFQLGVMPTAPAPSGTTAPTFGDMLMAGLRQVDTKVAHANAMAKAFVLDDSIPVHQVTMALEEARMSVELAMQVRARLVEGYRELMNMQL